MSDRFLEYSRLVCKVDDFAGKVYKKHEDDIVCKKGCSQCCEKVLTFFPVEFMNIVDYIKRNNINKMKIKSNVYKLINDSLELCPFLFKQKCMIYEARPVICRTFGLPAVEFDDKNEIIDFHVCEKNFNTKDIDVTREYLINLNTLNAMLTIINAAFVSADTEFRNMDERISVIDIISYL